MIDAQIADLLRPLEDFEAVRRKAVRFGDRLCDLSYANPYQGAHERAIAVIEEALRDRRLLSLQYSPFGGQTIARRLVADALRESHGLPFAYGDVILTPGAMSALHLALLTAVDQGGEVIIPTPCWLDCHVYVLHAGGLPVSVPLAPEELALDVDAIA